jgi:hypothetical protein
MLKKFAPYLILFGISYLTFDSLYQHFTQPKSARSDRLACHQKTIVFERLYHDNRLNLLKQKIKEGDYQLITSSEPSVYMESQLFESVNADDVAQQFLNTLSEGKSNPNSDTTLKLNIYENDKKHPGKKTAKSKLYTGYLVLTILDKNRLVYKVQIDFNQPKGEDILEQIVCIKRTIETL